MKNVFSSAQRRINRAKEHSNHVQLKAREFIESKPYAEVSEPDAQSPEIVLHKMKFTGDLPDSITDAAVEAIEHLRSALDQAAFAVARRKGNRGTYFPFADSASELEHVIKSKCEHVPNEIIALFRFFKPYKGGDDLLWALNKLCNSQKHRLIVPVGIVVKGMHINKMTITGPASLPFPTWDGGKNEIVFARTSPQGTLKYDFDLYLGVSFGKVDVVAGQPVLAVLRAFTHKVESIVSATEAEARRIGLIA